MVLCCAKIAQPVLEPVICDIEPLQRGQIALQFECHPVRVEPDIRAIGAQRSLHVTQ